jgi:hypothetical protein
VKHAGQKNNMIQQSVNYCRRDIAKLPSHKKTETLTCIGKLKNSINRGSESSETYEIIREKPNDEESRILALRELGDDRLEMANQDHE